MEEEDKMVLSNIGLPDSKTAKLPYFQVAMLPYYHIARFLDWQIARAGQIARLPGLARLPDIQITKWQNCQIAILLY